MDAARGRLVEGFWTQHHLARSAARSDRLAADEWWWAYAAVDEEMTHPTESALDLLDDLLRAPSADIGAVGCGPLEDLLVEHGATYADKVATRARQDPVWREAVGAVWLDLPLAECFAPLVPFLQSGPK